MQISNNISSLAALRQPSRLSGGQDNQKLIFIYPILNSTTLSKEAEILRDFLAVEFISQIKISNGLNITSKLSKVGTVGIGDKSINPAVEVRKSLNFKIPDIQNNSNFNINLGEPNDFELQKYQQKITQFAQFFKKQIEINPQYKKYSPVISTIVADENLLVFPLIVGTKTFPIDVNILFYILSAAIILDLPLNSLGNLNRIINYIEHLDLERFQNIFTQPDGEHPDDRRNRLLTPNTMPRLWRNDEKNIDKFNNRDHQLFKLEKLTSGLAKVVANFKKVLTFDNWNAESDHLMSQNNYLSADNVPIIQTTTQRRHFEAAMNSFNSYTSEIIVPILYGMETILGPTPSHINFHSAVQDFLNNITKGMDQHYIQTAEHIRIKLAEMPTQSDENGNPIYNLKVDLKDKFNNVQNNLDTLKHFCQSNVEIVDSVRNILYTELIPNLRNLNVTEPDNISSFCDSVVQTSSKLQPLSNTIESWALSSVPDAENNLQSKFDDIKELFRRNTEEFFNGHDDHRYAILNMNLPANEFANRYANFNSVFCGHNDPNNPPNDNQSRECAQVLLQIVTQIKQAIGDILYFLFIWNFMSYICSYISEIDIDIQIQKKDALDFPNYTLILPIEMCKFLYTFFVSNRLKRLLKSPTFNGNDIGEAASNIKNNLTSFSPNTSIPKLIEIINDRFKIPNIMVVDKYKEEVYYQFMYMPKPLKTRLGSLPSYITSQKDVISVN